MAGIVKIDYKIGGEDAVLRSFKTVIGAAQAQAKETVKAAKAAASQVVNVEEKAANQRAKILDRLADQAAARSKRAQDAEERALRRTQAAKGALIVKEMRENKRLADQKLAEAKRGLDKLDAENKRAEKRKEAREAAAADRSAARSVREQELRERAEARAERRRLAVRRMEERKGERINTAMQFARIDDINHRRAGVRGALGDAIKRGASSGVGMIQAGAGLVGGYLGTQTVLDAGRSQLSLDKRGALLNNATDGTAGNVVGDAKKISNIVGEDAGDVMTGFEKVAAKSGAGGLAEVRGEFLALAKVAKGAGIEMGDMGDVIGTLYNRGIKAKDMVKTVENLVQQGKDGAVEFKDLATMLDASSGALGRFNMGEGARITTAGGLSQLARTYGKKSPEEATNAVEDLARDLGGKGDIVQRLTGGTVKSRKLIGGKMTQVLGGGVEVGTDATRAQLKDVNDLLPDIIEGAFKKGNAGKLMGEGGIFTGNSTAIVAPLIQAYNKGITKDASGRYQLTTEGQRSELSGRAAAAKLLEQFRGGSAKPGASNEAFNRVMGTDAGKFELAMNNLKNTLGDKLGPELAKAAPQVTRFIEAFGKITIWAMSNPFKAMGAVVMASIAQSLVGAAGSHLLDKLLGKAIPAMTVTAGTVNVAGGPGGANAAQGMLGGASGAAIIGGLIAAAVVAYMASKAITDQLDSDLAKKDEENKLGLSLAEKISAGKASEPEIEQAALLWGEQREERGRGVVGRFLNESARPFMNIAQNQDGGAGNATNWVRAAFAPAAGAAAVAADDTAGPRQQSIEALEAAFSRANKSEAMLTAMQKIASTNEQVAAAVAAGGLQEPKVKP